MTEQNQSNKQIQWRGTCLGTSIGVNKAEETTVGGEGAGYYLGMKWAMVFVVIFPICLILPGGIIEARRLWPDRFILQYHQYYSTNT